MKVILNSLIILSKNIYAILISINSSYIAYLYKIVMVIFFLLICFFYISRFHLIYNIPVNKPYFTGEWDEPFAINAGINALRYGLNPIFYKYGGTSVYPESLIFFIYEKITGKKSFYSYYNKKMGLNNWPITRKTYPVKPIYIGKVVAFLLFSIGSLVYISLFTLLLLPIPFWPVQISLNPWINSSDIMGYYSFQMLPTAQLALLAGITSIFFFKALFEEDGKKKFIWIILSAIFASISVSCQLSSAFILLLPLSLSVNFIIKGYMKGWGKKMVLILSLILPYILINPASWLSSPDYRKWIYTMAQNSRVSEGLWHQRISVITNFVKDLHILSTLGVALLIILFALTVIIFIKMDKIAFLGFFIFYFYSFYKIANMNEMVFERHFSFLILPAIFWFTLPFVYIYLKSKQNLRILLAVILLLGTLYTYPYASVINGVKSLFNDKYSDIWPKESRDYLSNFVLDNKCKVYFYDYHNFSLPENLENYLTAFSDIKDIPSKLAKNEYVGIILYATSNINEYNMMKDKLFLKYKIVKVFGNPKGSYDIGDESPLTNPTIILLR